MADNPLLPWVAGWGVGRQNPLAPGAPAPQPRPEARATVRGVLDEYMDPSKRGVGVNTVLGFTEGPATVGVTRFPLVPGQGVQQVEVGPTLLEYRVRPDQSVLIDRLDTLPEARGQGQARNAMQQFLAAIDAQGLRSELIAEPQEVGVSFDRLRRFYRSLGFKSERGAPEMMRRKPMPPGGFPPG